VEAYERERLALKSLLSASCERVVEYIYSFRAVDFAIDQETARETYNIILKYGERDLWLCLISSLPPVTSQEICRYWKNVHGISIALENVYDFRLDDVDYYTYVALDRLG